MKVCYICGTQNFKSNNYCIHCGNKMTKDNFCPHCGTLNSDEAKFCKYCSNQLRPVEINGFNDLFTPFNLQLLANYDLTPQKYAKIVRNLFDKANYSRIVGTDIKEKIWNFCQIFARCIPKVREGEYGHNFGNVIFYDDRLDDSIQIATLLHELTHCLLFNLLSEILCEIFEVNHSVFIDSFVWFVLTNDDMLLLNEHCASTVSGRYTPFGYQDYGSFKRLLNQSQIDEETLFNIIRLSASISNDLCSWLDDFITEKMREEIKFLFKVDQITENPDAFEYEILNPFDILDKISKLKEYLLIYFATVMQVPEIIKELESYMNLF